MPGTGDDGATPHPIEGVLFDATGTLITTHETVGQVYSSMAREHGVELPAWRLDDAFRRVLKRAQPRDLRASQDHAEADRAWWRAVVRSTFLAADSSVRFDNFDALFEALFELYSGGSAWCLREGCAELLPELRSRGLRLGVVSNFDQRLMNILQELEIIAFFESVMIPSRCGFQKPDPAIFERALDELGLSARAAVYVGDDPEKDLAAATALGMRTIDIRPLATLEDLPAHLDSLEARGD